MPNRTPFYWLVVVAISTAGVAGCTAEAQRYIRFPDFLHPGWAGQQRAEAVEHDPYPLDDVGPEVVGGRPREYQRPVNEVERARMAASPPVAFQPIPVPTFPAAPPPVITTPYPTVPAPPFPMQQRSPY